MPKEKEVVAAVEVNNLTVPQKARLEALSARPVETLTGAEKRELEDLKSDSKLPVAPTVGYVLEGSPTVYVVKETPKTKVVVSSGPVANIIGLTAEDFNEKFEVVK